MLFDPKYFKTLSKNEKIEYLNNCDDETITLNISNYSDIIYILNEKGLFGSNQICIDEDYVMAHAKKRFTCNGSDVLFTLCHSSSVGGKRTEIITKVIDLYVEKGWISKNNTNDLIFNVFGYDYPFDPRPEKFYDSIIELYDRLQIPINTPYSNNIIRYNTKDLLCHCAQRGSSDNFIKIFELYDKRCYAISDNVFQLYLTRNFGDYKEKNINKIIQLCNKHNIKIVSKLALTKFATYCDSWMIIKDMFEKIIADKFNTEDMSDAIVVIGARFGLDENLFVYYNIIQKYGIDIYNIKTDRLEGTSIIIRYIDAIIMYNKDKKVFEFLLHQGIKPQNNLIKIYSPCWDCVNGESHGCNYRNITTNYVCTFRYNKSIDELIKEQKIEKCDDMRFCYVYFCNDADSNQVFNVAGKGELTEKCDCEEDKEDDLRWPYIKYQINPEILSLDLIKSGNNSEHICF